MRVFIKYNDLSYRELTYQIDNLSSNFSNCDKYF
jgi:hypothetical protein